jgi:hypothetical protein
MIPPDAPAGLGRAWAEGACPSSQILDQAEAAIADQLYTSICGAPEPAVFMICPPLQ